MDVGLPISCHALTWILRSTWGTLLKHCYYSNKRIMRSLRMWFPIPMQLPCASRLKPSGQRGLELHLNEPSVFTHSWSCPQLWLCCTHSLISEMNSFMRHWRARTRLTKNEAQIQCRAAETLRRCPDWPQRGTVVKRQITWRRSICCSPSVKKLFLPKELNLD